MLINLFKQPTTVEMLQLQLAEAERSRVEQLQDAEYAQAMADMLGKRIARIKGELSTLLPTTHPKENK
jgi:hypothetical protein